MKYFVPTITTLLYTLNLHAETIEVSDTIIVPEYFQQSQSVELQSSPEIYVEEQEVQNVDNSIIVPEDFQQSQSVELPSSPEVYVEEQEVQSVDSSVIVPDDFQQSQSVEILSSPEIYVEEPTAENVDNSIIVPDSFKEANTPLTNPQTQIDAPVNIANEQVVADKSMTNKVIDTDTDIPNDDYTGYYNFVRGTDAVENMFKGLAGGFLVIEKLDENDFGFYYVIQHQQYAPNERYGIFHYKKGKFYQKFIGDAHYRDNVKLVKDGSTLETVIKDIKSTQSVIWEMGSANDIQTLSPKLQKSLAHAKEDYRQIYKERFTN